MHASPLQVVADISPSSPANFLNRRSRVISSFEKTPRRITRSGFLHAHMRHAMHRLWHMFLSFYFGRAASCGKKVRHRTEAVAIKVKTKMEQKHSPKRFDTYHCFWCKSWHIGGTTEGRLAASAWNRALQLMRIR
jgi:hypothetical protein